MKRFAVELGLEETPFNECLDTGKYSDLVNSETRWAQSVGVQSTPTIVVNGYAVLGAQSMSVFENLFSQILDQ